jgi:hypothetical protein
MDEQTQKNDYTAPVDKLLTYGDPRKQPEWPDYLALGLTEGHIPELIRMALDKDLNFADSDSSEVWAPLHAWRTLGQLRAEAAIEPLLDLFEMFEDPDLGGGDWVSDELPLVYAMIGTKAIPILGTYLKDITKLMYPRIDAALALVKIAQTHPETRSECVTEITQALEKFNDNEPDLNGFLVSDLVDLGAVEVLEVIKAAYIVDQVDESIAGDFYDVQVELGLIEPDPEVEAERASFAQARMDIYDTMLRNQFLPPYADLRDDTPLIRSLKQEKQAKKKTKAKRKKTEKMKKMNRKKKR